MTMYAQVINGAIERINIQLPTVINGTTIPQGADGLEAFDLYPITGSEPAYDPATQRMQGPTYQVNGDVVERIYTVEPIPAEEIANRIKAEITTAVQARLDDFAKTRGYDGILSACTYATSGVPKFAAEGQACVDGRDATWATLYTIMESVSAGTRPMPSGYADVEADLPVLVWPA